MPRQPHRRRARCTPGAVAPHRGLAPVDPAYVLDLLADACCEANGKTSDVELIGELACAAAYAFHEGRASFERMRRGVARLRAADSDWTAGQIQDEVMNLNWVTAIWVGKFTAALLLQGFDPAGLLEEEASPATIGAIGAALAAAGQADPAFANEWEIGTGYPRGRDLR